MFFSLFGNKVKKGGIEMKRLAVCLMMCVLVVVGCDTTVPDANTTEAVINVGDPQIEFSKGDSNVVTVSVGLTYVNPNFYQGWDGACPGCDIDARGMFNLFRSKRYTSYLLLNSVATWRSVRATILNTSRLVRHGGVLIVTMSGHGGQLNDDNGDELDGMDETICLWDGQVRDDEILKMIGEMPNIRLVLINDQCHSEGNFRSVLRDVQQTVSLGSWGKRTARPLARDVTKVDIRGWGGQLIQFAGCRENNYSYGSNVGGTWTMSLLGAFNTNLTWKGWFDEGKKKMPANQIPQFVEFGAVQETFRNGSVLK